MWVSLVSEGRTPAAFRSPGTIRTVRSPRSVATFPPVYVETPPPLFVAKEFLPARRYPGNVPGTIEPRIAADGVGTMGKDGRDAHRVTLTLTHSQHAELERIARKSGAKVAWVARRAVERLIEQENGGPLLPLDVGGLDAAQR